MLKKFLSPDEILRRAFEKHVMRDLNGCWRWVGPKSKTGYGKVMITVSAHRLAYLLKHGSIPEGLVLDHQCNEKICCNPDHLKPVSNWENIMRGHGLAAANAKKKTCPAGHVYNPKNTAWTGRHRYCKACKRRKALARYYKLKSKGAVA